MGEETEVKKEEENKEEKPSVDIAGILQGTKFPSLEKLATGYNEADVRIQSLKKEQEENQKSFQALEVENKTLKEKLDLFSQDTPEEEEEKKPFNLSEAIQEELVKRDEVIKQRKQKQLEQHVTAVQNEFGTKAEEASRILASLSSKDEYKGKTFDYLMGITKGLIQNPPATKVPQSIYSPNSEVGNSSQSAEGATDMGSLMRECYDKKTNRLRPDFIKRALALKQS